MGAEDIFETLKLRFNNMVPAQALFFKWGTHNALRVEAPTIGKEFTDSAWIGTDPEGWLFFNSLSDFDEATSYEVYQVFNPVDTKPCSQVKFSFTQDPGAGYFAEFFAYDPTQVVTVCSMNNYKSTGKWVDLVVGSATGHVNKTYTGTIITMTCDAIGKKASFTDTDRLFPSRKAITSKGTFSFKKLSDIGKATYANYNKDRIVFYTSPHAYDFVGYFIPFEGATTEEVNANSLGEVNHEFGGVTWTNI